MHTGEIAALFTAWCWVISALSFEASGRRIGSLAVNIIRLVMAFLFMALFLIISQGIWLPQVAEDGSFWLLFLSGFTGFFIGDLFLFRSFIEIGSRISLLILSFVPLVTAILEWLFTRQVLSTQGWISMGITLGGVLLVMVKKEQNRMIFIHPSRGILLAVGGMLGQSAGMVFSRMGIGSTSAVQASQIRVLAGISGFIPLYFILKVWPRVFSGMKNKKAMAQLSLGALFGPFIGIALSLYAMQHTSASIVAIITALVPVFVIAPAVLFFKEKVTIKEIAGACIAVTGVSILFL